MAQTAQIGLDNRPTGAVKRAKPQDLIQGAASLGGWTSGHDSSRQQDLEHAAAGIGDCFAFPPSQTGMQVLTPMLDRHGVHQLLHGQGGHRTRRMEIHGEEWAVETEKEGAGCHRLGKADHVLQACCPTDETPMRNRAGDANNQATAQSAVERNINEADVITSTWIGAGRQVSRIDSGAVAHVGSVENGRAEHTML